MDVMIWKMMLERRGYQVDLRIEGNDVYYSFPGYQSKHANVRGGGYKLQYFEQLTYKGARRKIDREIGWGMMHCEHSCGCPILRAQPNYMYQYPGDRSHERLTKTVYYAVPFFHNSPVIVACPRCGEPLNGKTVHRVEDIGLGEE